MDTARSNEIETPVPNGLDPEKFLTLDAGFKYDFKKVYGTLSYYYTDINDMIIRTPTGRTIGTDLEVTKKNSGDGYVTGVEFDLNYNISKSFFFHLKSAWQDGEIDTFKTSATVKEKDHLSRLLPMTSIFGLKYQRPNSNWWFEAVLTIAEKQDKLSQRDIGDTQRIPPGGTPSYEVITVRGGKKISDRFNLTLALENLTDEDYRVHGSGLNEPGFNTIVGLKATF